MPRQRAFTLIELMVVIVLIGILTAMIIPEMKGTYQDALLRSTSRRLIDVFSLASSRAVSLNQLHRVRLDESTGQYILEYRVRAGQAGGEFVPVEDVPGSEGELDRRISVVMHGPEEAASDSTEAPPPEVPAEGAGATEGQGAIVFYPDGTTDGGTIELQDQEGFKLVLRLNPVTARVHIVELGRE
jgi:type II secretion system protein H